VADEAPPPPGAPLWIVSFGDMISNMVTFFILLAAFSTPSEADTDSREMAVHVKEKGVFDSGRKRSLVKKHASNDAKLETDGAEKPSQRSEQSLDRKLDTFVMNSDYKVKPDFSKLPDGLKVTVQADRMFAPGDATLRPEAAEIITEIGKFFRGEDCEYVVEAHVDARSHRYAGDASPLDLSRRMAIAAFVRLTQDAGVEPHRVAVSAKGASEPVASDEEAAGRAKNRRVVIYVRKTS
jgi:chemotaxis protein MotB